VFRFVTSLRADIKHEVKVHPLYFLDVAYQKALDYKKYLCIIPRHILFNPYTRPSHPSTFPRSHPSTQPINTTLPSGSTFGASFTSLAKTTLHISSSDRLFTTQIECHYYHAKGYIVSRCP